MSVTLGRAMLHNFIQPLWQSSEVFSLKKFWSDGATEAQKSWVNSSAIWISLHKLSKSWIPPLTLLVIVHPEKDDVTWVRSGMKNTAQNDLQMLSEGTFSVITWLKKFLPLFQRTPCINLGPCWTRWTHGGRRGGRCPHSLLARGQPVRCSGNTKTQWPHDLVSGVCGPRTGWGDATDVGDTEHNSISSVGNHLGVTLAEGRIASNDFQVEIWCLPQVQPGHLSIKDNFA